MIYISTEFIKVRIKNTFCNILPKPAPLNLKRNHVFFITCLPFPSVSKTKVQEVKNPPKHKLVHINVQINWLVQIWNCLTFRQRWQNVLWSNRLWSMLPLSCPVQSSVTIKKEANSLTWHPLCLQKQFFTPELEEPQNSLSNDKK